MKRRSWRALNQDIVKCQACPRLREYCADIATTKRRAYVEFDYWGLPVPNFGDPQARLLIVGLAPAAHGANRTGRMFTGDRSGDWLYRALQKAGFSNQADSHARNDGLRLRDCAITAVCHCAPPGNRPNRDEISNCQAWLQQTFDATRVRIVLALGQIAWQATVDELRRRGWYEGRRPKFGHGQRVELGAGRWLFASYHPSQQNTFTGRLTEAMFDEVFSQIRGLL